MDDDPLQSAAQSLTPASSTSLRIWLNRIGALLGIVGVAFVAYRLHGYLGELDLQRFGRPSYVAAVLLAVVYGASNLLLALGWRAVLQFLGVDAGLDWTIRAYATSQLAKYIPGNIFHFAGRQALGVAAGIGNVPLAKSTAIELAILAIGGALFLPLLLQHAVPGSGAATAVVAFGAPIAVVFVATWRLAGGTAARSVALYLAFLVLSGLIFVLTLSLAEGRTIDASAVPLTVGAYVVAWLAGLLTPGAPAGLGIREAVLLALLAGIASGPVVLTAVLVGRIITVSGDLMFYAAGRLLPLTTERAIR